MDFNQQNQQQQQPSINITQTSKIECECGCSLFDSSFVLRKASAFITGNGKEGVIPIPLFTCKECGKILDQTVPPELKSLDL